MMDLATQSKFFEYLASDQCDIQKICRLCMSVKIDKELNSLLDQVPGGRMVDLFTFLTSIEVVLSDKDLPCCVCTECTDQLLKSCEFKRRCEKSDSSLKSLLKGEYVKYELPDEVEMKFEDHASFNNLEPIVDCKTVKTNYKEKTKNIKRTKKTEKISKKAQFALQENRFQCHLCTNKFEKATLLTEHINSTHKGGPAEATELSCAMCKEQFEEPQDLDLHASIHQPGPPWKCVKCLKEFISHSALRRHVPRHMRYKKHRCERCGKTFSERFALTRHRRVHTGQPADRRHLCVQCGKCFAESARLRQHMSSHSALRPHACPAPACGKRFRSARLLTSHARVHDAARPHRCRYCDKRFRHESTCKSHERIHTGERPYVCAACGKTFLQSSNLNLHMRTHSGERPYACSVCSRCFKSSSSLKTHLRTHTGEKPYSCHICHKRSKMDMVNGSTEIEGNKINCTGHPELTFLRNVFRFVRSDMSAHLRRHVGDRPFPCSACPRRFYTGSRLREHYTVVHSGDKPFECAICGQRLATKSHLLKHIKSHQKKKATAEKKKLLVLRVTDDTPYTSLPDDYPIILSNDGCGEVVISNECDDITNVASSDMTVSLANAVPLQMVQEENSLSFNQINNVNLVTVSEATSAMEGASVRLYQLDQSLVQIHSAGGQVTISKITSKMTANFE